MRGAEDITPVFESYHALAHSASIRQSLEKFEWVGEVREEREKERERREGEKEGERPSSALRKVQTAPRSASVARQHSQGWRGLR